MTTKVSLVKITILITKLKVYFSKCVFVVNSTKFTPTKVSLYTVNRVNTRVKFSEVEYLFLEILASANQAGFCSNSHI